jgi:hypothetical protein
MAANDPITIQTTRILAEAILENAEGSVLDADPEHPQVHPVYNEIQRLKRQHALWWDDGEVRAD